MRYDFASDNTAAVHPEAWRALAAANHDAVPSYGDDPWTARAADAFRALFECDCEVFFVFNGTAANSLALAACCQSYHSVVCLESSHIVTDECGAPEFFSNGTKLLPTPGAGGKLLPAEVTTMITKRRDIHYPKPRVISLTQPSEFGTVYTPAEVRALSAVARTHGLRVHVDGARFANAVASLDVAPRTLTWEAGVDVLCFGGTKLGLGPVGEAVVFFDKALAAEFDYRCKQAGQLASKMRYLAAPWAELLPSGRWLELARHANTCAQALAAGFTARGVELLHPVQANAVFARLNPAQATALQAAGWKYYTFIGGGARFMCSWQTTDTAVQALLAALP